MDEWNPNEIELKQVRKSSIITTKNHNFVQAINVHQTNPHECVWQYDSPTTDEAILHSISPILTNWVQNVNPSPYSSQLDSLHEPRTYISTKRHIQIIAEDLAEKFCIGLERAKTTLRATRQRGTRSVILPISRRYRADRRFDVKRLEGKFVTDTL